MSEQKFYKCNKCHTLVAVIHDGGEPMGCCEEAMQRLTANSVEASAEKHIPEVSTKERLLHAKVGSAPHPMTPEHHIEFIYLQTQNGGQMRCLTPPEAAQAMFVMDHDKPITVFAYCNLHGLWKAEVQCDCGCGEKAPDCQ